MEKGYLLILYIYPIPLPPNFHVLLMNLIVVSVESLEFCKDTIINYFIYQFYYINSEKAMAPHSSTLAWKIPWTEEPGGLQSMGLLRVQQDWATSLSLFTFMHWRRKWQPTPVSLPGESQESGA